MGEKEKERPTISVPPRAPFESFFIGGSIPGFSPGPMTLVSNLFSPGPDSDGLSFSQLLAGAMSSPIGIPSAKQTLFSAADNYYSTNTNTNNIDDGSLGKEAEEKKSGYKQNRPMSLTLAQSPMFMVPPGLSPSGLLNSPGFFSPLQSPFGMSHQQALAHVTAQAALSQSFMQMQAEFQRSAQTAASVETLEHQPSIVPNETSQPQVQSVTTDQESKKVESSEVPVSDRKAASVAFDKPVSDGYNWRKYGQKQVKASEHPRSYYKCTHLNCPVKKKVERSMDGHITEITYKGQHNHEPPQPSKRTKDGSGSAGTTNTQFKAELRTETNQSKEALHSHSLPAHVSSEQLPLSNDHDEAEDSAVVIDEGDDDEPNAKRRSTENGTAVRVSSHNTVSEPRIIVQTRSEVDLLDDGFKWRKYGQKVVKGNPHPRSYYRCTYAGCNVRKHVERASSDPKSVITTYEGKHNHDAPTSRHASHNTSNNSAHQLKQQRTDSADPSLNNKDQTPIFLQLKEEQIAA